MHKEFEVDIGGEIAVVDMMTRWELIVSGEAVWQHKGSRHAMIGSAFLNIH